MYTHAINLDATPERIVGAWPPVTCPVHRAPKLHLVHLSTQVNPGDIDKPSTGQTLWGSASGDGAAGVAWDWVQIQEGVVAMVDPFALVTNLQLVSAQGRALPHFEVALQLNQLVHSLPWQSEVQRVLAEVHH